MIADRYEIDDAEKELFTQTIERLEPFIGIHVPNFDDDESVAIEKDGTFRLDETLIEISSSDIIDRTNKQLSKGYSVKTTQEVTLGGIRLVTTTYYVVDRYNNGPRWETYAARSDEVHDPAQEEPITLPNDHKREVRDFWRSHPSAEEKAEYRRRQALEEEESGSKQDPSRRFTKARLWRILPLLQQLGPEHLVDARVW